MFLMACGIAVSYLVISCNSGAKKEAAPEADGEKTEAPAPEVKEVAAPHTLTEAEKADGWVLLFDGENSTGWRGFNQETFPEIWQIVDGTMYC